VQPSHVVLGEREQARMRKSKLQALAEADHEDSNSEDMESKQVVGG